MRRLAARARDRAERRVFAASWHGNVLQHGDWRAQRPQEVIRGQRRLIGKVRDESAWGWLGITRDAAWLQPVARGSDPLQFLRGFGWAWESICGWVCGECALRWLATCMGGRDETVVRAALRMAAYAIAIRDRRSVFVAWAARRVGAGFGRRLAADRATATRILRRYVLIRTKSDPPPSHWELVREGLSEFAYRHQCERYLAARLGIA